MRDPSSDLIPIVQRSYDLCAGLYEHVNRFPRAQRTLLGRVILEDAVQMLVLLTVANRHRAKGTSLAEASGRLDALRVTLRLSKRLGFLSNGGYASLAELADEVGRMLGGWLKHEAAPVIGPTEKPGSATRAPETASAATTTPRKRGTRYTMTSPTVERYLRVRLAHPEAIVFVRVGVFYQSFFEDAAFCGRAIGLAVRDFAATSEPEKILACGFPVGALEKYVQLLRRAGRDVHVE